MKKSTGNKKQTLPTVQNTDMQFPVRLNKYLAHMNYSTRRGADMLIEQGKVFINGKVATLGDKVHEKDSVKVTGETKKDYVYYAYYKPRGIVTIGAQQDEKEIADVAKFPEKVFPIGRLDKDSEGLIIMTNDGRITQELLDPDYDHEKEYQITVDRPITHQFLVGLKNGVRIDVGRKKYMTRPSLVKKNSKFSFDIVLTEGKNRQIRKMCGTLGFKVTKLKRFRIMNITLRGLKPGQFRKITISS